MSDLNIPATSSEQDTSVKSETDILAETEVEETTETGETQEETTEEVESEDSEDEEQEVATESEEEEESTSEETQEDTSVEEVESEEDQEQEARITRPSWSKIKKEYPKLAKDKDFKALYFRDLAMSEVFPTVAEAKESRQKADIYDELDSSLVSGNIPKVFQSLNPEVLDKLSEKILPTLYQIDKKFFQKATQPLIIDILNNFYEYAENISDANTSESLKKSAKNLALYLTGSKEIPKRISIASEAPEVRQELEKLRNERLTVFKAEERKFLTSADNLASKKINQMISENLDPEKKLTDFAKQAIIDRTLRDVKEKLQSDEGLTAKIKDLHRQAAKLNFVDSERFKSRILAATLDRARKLIPVIRNRHKFAALGKQAKSGDNNNKITTAGKETSDIRTTSSGKITSAKQIDTSKTSAEDFLSDKVVLRK